MSKMSRQFRINSSRAECKSPSLSLGCLVVSLILKARIDPFCLSADNLVHTAAAEIDQVISQVISRNMGRLVADRYYGLLCLCYRAWIYQKRSLGCSISTIQWPALAGHRRLILPPFCLPLRYLAAARASTPT